MTNKQTEHELICGVVETSKHLFRDFTRDPWFHVYSTAVNSKHKLFY